MALLPRESVQTGIGNVGVVRPTGYAAKAQAADQTAVAIGGLRDQILTGLIEDKYDEDRVLMEQNLLAVKDQWTQKFFEVREEDNSVELYNGFVNSSIEGHVSSVPEYLQGDMRTALTRLAMADEGALMEQRYQDALRDQRIAENNVANGLLLDFETGVDTLFLDDAMARNPDQILALGQEQIETIATEVPEELRGEWLVNAQRHLNDRVLSAAEEQKAHQEAVFKESFELIADQKLRDISSSIVTGEGNITAELDSMRSHIFGGIGTIYDSQAGAQSAFDAVLVSAQGDILATVAIDMALNGDSDGARNLIASFGAGQDVPGLMSLRENYAPSERTSIASAAVGRLNTFSFPDGLVSPTQELLQSTNETHDNLVALIDENPGAVTPSMVMGFSQDFETAFSNGRPLASTPNTNSERYRAIFGVSGLTEGSYHKSRRIQETALSLASPDYNTSQLALADWSALTAEEKADGLRWVDAANGWSTGGMMENLDMAAAAAHFAVMTNQATPALQGLFAQINGYGPNFSDPTLATLFTAARQMREQSPIAFNNAAGASVDTYISIMDQVQTNDPEILRGLMDREFGSPRQPNDIRRALENVDMLVARDANGESGGFHSVLVRQVQESIDAQTLFTSGLNESWDTINKKLTVDTSTGGLSILDEQTGDYLVPEAWEHMTRQYLAGTGQLSQILDSAGNLLAEIAHLHPSLSKSDFLSDPVVPMPNTNAYDEYVAIYRANIQEGHREQYAHSLTQSMMMEDGWGISAFSPESRFVTEDGDIERRYVWVKNGFEQSATLPVPMMLADIMVAGQNWLRDGHIDLDIGDALDDGRIEIIPVADFNPADPKYNVFVEPTGPGHTFEGKILLFSGEGNNGVWSPGVDTLTERAVLEMVKATQDLGIESDYLANLTAGLLTTMREAMTEGESSQTFEGLTDLGINIITLGEHGYEPLPRDHMEVTGHEDKNVLIPPHLEVPIAD